MYSILLIEDNDYIVKGIKYLLEANNYRLTIAKNLKEANSLIENKYDLIILDLMLPDGDGLEFYKKKLSHKTTLILTAKDAGRSVYRLELIHGYHSGTQLRDMIRRTYAGHPKVLRLELGLNPGVTELVLREY